MDWEEQYNKIYRYCYFRMRHRERAEDLTQETFLRFFESATYRHTGQALQYLYTIARNLCIDEYRKHGDEPWEESAAEANMEDKVLDQIALEVALSELAEEERELLLLRYVNEVPVSVMANMLGISRFAVYRKLMKVSKHLREKLGKENFL